MEKTRSAGRRIASAPGRVTERAGSLVEGPRAAIERGRSNPRVAIAAIVAALLLVAWVAWAIYVTRDNGANAGLGVVLSWPVLLVALALIASPFIGLYLLVRHLSSTDEGEEKALDDDQDGEEESEVEEDEGEEADEAEEEEPDEEEPEEEEPEEEEPEETDPDEEPPSGEKAAPVSS